MFGINVDDALEKFDKLIATLERMNKLLVETNRQMEILNTNIEKQNKQLSKKDG